MSVLSDYGIAHAINAGDIRVYPKLLAGQIQTASIDLTLAGTLLEFDGDPHEPIDPEDPPAMRRRLSLGDARGEVWVLYPGEFVLGSTQQNIELGNGLAAQIDGRSSLGRLGLAVHSTAGWVDPGYVGNLTLELFNASGRSMILRPGMPIAQLVLHRLSHTPLRPYGSPGLGSRYVGPSSIGPVPSRGVSALSLLNAADPGVQRRHLDA